MPSAKHSSPSGYPSTPSSPKLRSLKRFEGCSALSFSRSFIPRKRISAEMIETPWRTLPPTALQVEPILTAARKRLPLHFGGRYTDRTIDCRLFSTLQLLRNLIQWCTMTRDNGYDGGACGPANGVSTSNQIRSIRVIDIQIVALNGWETFQIWLLNCCGVSLKTILYIELVRSNWEILHTFMLYDERSIFFFRSLILFALIKL